MKHKKLFIALSIVVMLVVFAFISPILGRFDVNFAESCHFSFTADKTGTSYEMSEKDLRDIQTLIDGKKLWVQDQTIRTDVKLVFSDGSKNVTLNVFLADGIIVTDDGRTIRLMDFEANHLNEMLSRYAG